MGIKSLNIVKEIIGRSIVASRDLNKGDIITKDDITYKRPGYGIRPYDEDKILGHA